MRVHARPVRHVGVCDIAQHMIDRGIFVEDEQEQATLVGERQRVEVEDDRDEGAHVEDTEGLCMKGGNVIGVRCGAVVTTRNMGGGAGRQRVR